MVFFTMKKIINTAVAVVLIGSMVTCFTIFFAHRQEHHLSSIPEFKVVKPWRETLDVPVEYVAQIKAIQHIELRSYEKGYLQKIFVDEGQFVKRGQVMFKLMPYIMQAEFDEAKAEYKINDIEYQNTKTLEAKKVVSENELSLAKARLDKAKARMDLAKIHVEFATIRAPFDGIMDRFKVRLGSLVDEGELLTSISDNKNVWVYFYVSEADYLAYMKTKKAKEEVPISLLLADGSIFEHQGKVDTIEADFNNETGNIAFRASFPNPDKLLRHGETGNVVLRETFNNALVIPQQATFEVLDKKYVYLMDDNNRIESRQISILHELPHFYIVNHGLTTNDTILLDNLGKARLGEKIKSRLQSVQEVKASLQLPVK